MRTFRLDARTIGSGIAIASLAFMMSGVSGSQLSLGAGLGGIAAFLLTRLAPKRRPMPTAARAAPVVAPAPAAADFDASATIKAAYRTNGVHPALVKDVVVSGVRMAG